MPNNNKISYVYPGANDLRNIEPDPFLKIHGNPVLITLSRLAKRKGHIEILKIIKKFITNYPTLQYIIAGEGEEKLNLQKFVDYNKLRLHFKFAG